jgi:DNA-binding NarL/FixJ family response regulator
MERIKFVIVERSYLIRKGLSSIINRIEHATVVKELENLDSINSVILKYSPDFLVINISLLSAIANIRNSAIKTDLSQTVIGIDPDYLTEKSDLPPMREIIRTLDERDEIYRKLRDLINEKVSSRHKLFVHSELSEREKIILKNVAKGLTNREIAEILHLSAHTVITHRKNITSKLGIKSISGLTVYAILNNIISMDDLEGEV